MYPLRYRTRHRTSVKRKRQGFQTPSLEPLEARVALATFLGPTPYLSRADSPFDLSGLGTTFFLEDFEDHALNTPGVSVSGVDVRPQSGYGGNPIYWDSVEQPGDDLPGQGIPGLT